LPPIIPLVIYHGTRSWSAGESFSHILPCEHEALRSYTPDFRFLLYDLSKYSDEEIRGEVLVRVSMLTLKYILRKDLREKLGSILQLWNELAGKRSGIDYLKVLLCYLGDRSAEQGGTAAGYFTDSGRRQAYADYC
jgi:hypothetical protein